MKEMEPFPPGALIKQSRTCLDGGSLTQHINIRPFFITVLYSLFLEYWTDCQQGDDFQMQRI